MPGQNSVSFQAPQAPVSRWRVRIPQAGVKVNLHPLIAATEVPAAARPRRQDRQAGRSQARRPTRPSCWPSSARRRWSASTGPPRPRAPPAWPPWSASRPSSRCGSTRGPPAAASTLTYSVSRAELGQLAVEVPADYKVVNVFDANVRQWSVEPLAAGAKTQKITAQLFEPAKKVQQVVVELEKFAGEKLPPSQTVPVVKAPGRGPPARRRGRPGGGRAPRGGHHAPAACSRSTPPNCPTPSAASPGPSPIATPRCPTSWCWASRSCSRGLRPTRWSRPGWSPSGSRSTSRRSTRSSAPGSSSWNSTCRRASPSATSAAATCPATRPTRAVAVQVDSHHLEGKNKDRLVVNLSHKAMGRVALAVELQKDLQEPKLLSPTDTAADIPLPVPQVAPGTVERAAGPLADFRPGEPAGQPGQGRGAPQHLLQGGHRRHVRRAAAVRGPGPRRAGLRLHPGADRPAPGRPAAKAPSDRPPVAGRPGSNRAW